MAFAYDDQPAFLDPSELATATPADALLDLIAKHRPQWHRDALCLEYPSVNFFPVRGETAAPARAVCRRCLVAAECRAAGASELYGIWGGLSINQRKGRRG